MSSPDPTLVSRGWLTSETNPTLNLVGPTNPGFILSFPVPGIRDWERDYIMNPGFAIAMPTSHTHFGGPCTKTRVWRDVAWPSLSLSLSLSLSPPLSTSSWPGSATPHYEDTCRDSQGNAYAGGVQGGSAEPPFFYPKGAGLNVKGMENRQRGWCELGITDHQVLPTPLIR